MGDVSLHLVIDCHDILNLSSHDGHWGALKLLRSLYERTVTAKYIEQNPEKADDFFDFELSITKLLWMQSQFKLDLHMRAESSRTWKHSQEGAEQIQISSLPHLRRAEAKTLLVLKSHPMPLRLRQDQ